jgi:hypothetical protein
VVTPIHAKAMPVLLTQPEEIETWMTAPADEALKLQRPLPDGALEIVARGVKKDEAPLERFTVLLNRWGFPDAAVCDSRCWLGWRPASDDPTSFQRSA